jgi:hypothetical protein
VSPHESILTFCLQFTISITLLFFAVCPEQKLKDLDFAELDFSHYGSIYLALTSDVEDVMADGEALQDEISLLQQFSARFAEWLHPNWS